MKRKYLEDLLKWKDDPRRKPLMVWGARQVGKTYLIKNLFADVYYKNKYLRIDCSSDNEFVEFAYKNTNLVKILNFISIRYNFNVDSEKLLIFDEAQECLPIISLMKQFCEERRDLPVIVTGSLVRIKIKRETNKRGQYARNKFLFPVGKINQLNIYPLTFDEFLMNYNENMYSAIKNAYSNRSDVGDLHNTYLKVYNEYIAIGGMPEVCDTYITEVKNKNPNALSIARKILKDIYTDYLDDMNLYQASPESVIRSKAIFENIYTQLNKECKNFKCSQIEKKSKTRDMLAPIDWLTTARVAIKSSELKERITNPLVSSNESLFRLYVSDVGIYSLQSNLTSSEFTANMYGEYSGYFYENAVATELFAREFKLFYWKGKRYSELEFIVEINSNIIPIEVKKTKGSLNSLIEFRNHNSNCAAIKISGNKFGFDKNNLILNVPHYFISFLLDDLQKGAINELNNIAKSDYFKQQRCIR